MNTTTASVLACENIVKVYRQGPQSIRVLDGINLTLRAGETLALVGASGAGKSTLLNILGGLDLPTEGNVYLQGNCLNRLNERERGLMRNRFMGFVYQFHHLLPEFSALENVMMPLFIGNVRRREAEDRAQSMLASVGLAERGSHKPAELSGGERQRVAIARALVTEPSCVFMDEPTGNLDTRTAKSVQSLIFELNARLNTSFIIVTHDEKLAGSLSRTVYLADGKFMADPGAIA